MSRRNIFIAIFLLANSLGQAQKSSQNLVYMDKQGVLRYTNGDAEASFYGVNYTTPFAHAYRVHKALKVDLEEAIRNDVYHFARLGLDAFRVHVWDNEISDTAGNLLENDHLRLYDFLLAECKKRNIKAIITPIAFWGNGYPDRDEATPGFSRYYGRGKLTTNDTAIRAQENYMRQFFKHVNPYTKLSYEDDKNIIAVELNNEPSHSNPKKGVTDYINRLAAAVKSTGWTKPIFYNIAQGPYFSDAVAASNVDGFSFQWYPSGLVGNRTLTGNVLPNVDRYYIPFRDTVPAFKNRALMVYEFDAADVMDSYMYPAMARAFRVAGFQWATQFSYDPMAMANVNTEYQTHYLNLAYTPSKAISMLIASEVFHHVPRLKNYPAYPADSSFESFRVSYINKLSEMNTRDKFYYSNSTNTNPVENRSLTKIAGVGNSPIISSSGTGAYFLDKIENGIWRLEIMPDVVYVRSPFERTASLRIVTQINWKEIAIHISLDDLGQNFSIQGLNKGNNYSGKSNRNPINVMPGTYLLVKNGKSFASGKKLPGPIGLTEFVAPSQVKNEILVKHEPNSAATLGKPLFIRATVGGNVTGKVIVQYMFDDEPIGRRMQLKKNGYEYSGEIPADSLKKGKLNYRIIVSGVDGNIMFPSMVKEDSLSWDNYKNYETDIRIPGSDLELYNPAKDVRPFIWPNIKRGFEIHYPEINSFRTVQVVSIRDMKDDEVVGYHHFIGDKLKSRSSELDLFDRIVIRGSTDGKPTVVVKITLIDNKGAAFASTLKILKIDPKEFNEMTDFELPLADLKPDSALLFPRPYPSFQPWYFKSSIANPKFDLAAIDKLEISVRTSYQISKNDLYELNIESVKLRSGKK